MVGLGLCCWCFVAYGCELRVGVLMLADSYGSFVCGNNACGIVAWVVFWLCGFWLGLLNC